MNYCLRLSLLASVFLPIPAAAEEPSVSERKSVQRPPLALIAPAAPQWSEWREPGPDYLSLADDLAVTVAGFPNAPGSPGMVQFWAAKSGEARANVLVPAPAHSMAGARGKGRLLVSGGEKKSEGEDTRYLWLFDHSGKVLAKLPPKHSDPEDLILKIDAEGRRAIVNGGNSGESEGEGYWLYDLTTPGALPVQVGNAEFDAFIPEPAAFPDLSSVEGVSATTYDSGFVLVREGSKAGIRELNGGATTYLGEVSGEWLDWSVASGGRHFVVWTREPGDGLTVWDLDAFLSQVINDPLYVSSITPALSPDGAWLRYARTIDSGSIEIVSHDLVNRVSRVDWQGGERKGEGLPPVEGKFSANGKHLCFFSGNEIWQVGWDDKGVPTAAKSSISLPETGLGWDTIIAVSDDGQQGVFSGLSRTEEFGEHAQEWVEMAAGKTLKKWGAVGMHRPHVHAAFHPRNSVLATSYYMSGPSMGYYQGEVEILPARGTKARIPEYSAVEMNSGGKYRDEYGDVLPEDDANGRKAHAWAVQFIQTGTVGEPLLAIYANNGCFRTWDTKARKFVHQYYWNEHSSAVYASGGMPIFRNIVARDGGRAFLPLEGGGIRVLKLPEADGPKVLADLWSLPGGGILAMTSEALYDCPEGAEKHVLVRKGDWWLPLTGGKDSGRVRAALAQ